MKLEIEKWIEDKEFSNDTLKIFKEAIICYKAEANRAALLFSYVGFMTIVKERILISNPPNGIDNKKWGDRQKTLLDENQWEEATLNTIQQKKSPVIFEIDESLRQQVLYWKNRRNDCAHAKNQTIKYYHVESFWIFLADNLSKFIVGGSTQNLLNKIDKHFDPLQTVAAEDYTNLVKEIENSVGHSELNNFFKNSDQIISKHSTQIEHSVLETYKRRIVDFWNLVLKQCNNDVKKELINYLKNEEKVLDFIRAYPNRISEIGLDYAFVLQNLLGNKGLIDKSDLVILSNFNQIKPISSNSFEELNEILLNKMSISNIDQNIEYFLENTHYFTAFKNKFLNGESIGHFEIGNRIRNQIIFYIEKFGLDVEVVKSIVKTMNQQYYPKHLSSELIRLFDKNIDLKNEFIKIARKNKIKGKKALIINEISAS